MTITLKRSAGQRSRWWAHLLAPARALSPEIGYIMGLFAATRLALIIVGLMARELLTPLVAPDALRTGAWLTPDHRDFSRWRVLDIWGVWDTRWYVDIARHGYAVYALTQIPWIATPATTPSSPSIRC